MERNQFSGVHVDDDAGDAVLLAVGNITFIRLTFYAHAAYLGMPHP
jgi:hypothetical protein